MRSRRIRPGVPLLHIHGVRNAHIHTRMPLFTFPTRVCCMVMASTCWPSFLVCSPDDQRFGASSLQLTSVCTIIICTGLLEARQSLHLLFADYFLLLIQPHCLVRVSSMSLRFVFSCRFAENEATEAHVYLLRFLCEASRSHVLYGFGRAWFGFPRCRLGGSNGRARECRHVHSPCRSYRAIQIGW
jgi:hypothetical protein